jgi:GTP-binding protein
MSLEQAIDFVNKDELVEITPKNIRLRKKQLTYSQRLRGISTAKLKVNKELSERQA